eukprot:32224-Eustigmatos_ZCMA.PRE.1
MRGTDAHRTHCSANLCLVHSLSCPLSAYSLSACVTHPAPVSALPIAEDSSTGGGRPKVAAAGTEGHPGHHHRISQGLCMVDRPLRCP